MHCVTCDVVIKTRPNFIHHKCFDAQTMHVVDIFCTKHCGKTFNNHHNHHLHELKCTGTMSMQCGECDAKFSSVDALNAHMKTCHPKRLEYPVCQNCNKAFMVHRSLARHCKTCVGEIKCKLCGQFFGQKCDHTHHFLKCCHKLACCECVMCFTSQVELDEHICMKHEGQEVITCLLCKLVFYTRASLDSHFQLYHVAK